MADVQSLTAARAATVKMLLADRCENYGYDWPDFRRLIAARSRARKAVALIMATKGVDALDWANAPNRLTVAETPEYVTGQSQNEEITGCLRVLARMRGGFYPPSRD